MHVPEAWVGHDFTKFWLDEKMVPVFQADHVAK